ncbi:aldose epimerase family protein [Macrococcoides caseolyticum]|uniref:aldose epimerase family protein n=1 Tax=Macrococcoides caseolyticum TaxID=69966 RepID=UPI001F41A853|nr:aldose epimerase family protein [Macrococcus caseolyticus]MCE4956024.1 galactose mutarotase [Macrococcus caseolyticus]
MTKQSEYKRYTIRNHNGLEVEVTDLGATITKIMLQSNNKTIDVVLGFEQLEAYKKHTSCYFGGIIGRVANRIANGTFNIDGKTYQTEQNEANNTLHSGGDGYQLRRWKVTTIKENELSLELISPHLDQGFPGTLKVTVTYTVTEDNALKIAYHGHSNEVTVFNPTNHSYFNLNGHDSGSVMQHQLWLDSHYYSELDDENIPTGEHLEVKATPMDFTTLKVIEENNTCGFDDNYVLNEPRLTHKCATLIGNTTGIQMDVYTNMPCIQLYTGNGLDNVPGKDGVIYNQYSGVCLETQFEPNSVNSDEPPLIDGMKTYQTVYKFIGV